MPVKFEGGSIPISKRVKRRNPSRDATLDALRFWMEKGKNISLRKHFEHYYISIIIFLSYHLILIEWSFKLS